MRRSAGLLAGDEEAYLSVLGLPSADRGDRWHGDARLQAVADGVVLGRLPDGDTFQRHFGPSAVRQLGLGSYKSAWLLCAKLRRAMVDPARDPLSGLVEVDETQIAYRTRDDPPAAGGRSGEGKLQVA